MSYSLTPEGLEDQLAAIYDLADSALETEADAIKKDFRSWVINHFTINEKEKNYLNDLPDRAVEYYGEECCFCFRYRLKIKLIFSPPPFEAARVGKWCDCESSTKLVVSDNGDITGTGEVIFTISYRSL